MEKGSLALYFGESGHSPYYRGGFHLNGLKSKNPRNVLYAHNQEHHPELQMTMEDFKMTVEGSFSRPLLRQSMEGVSLARAVKVRDSGCPEIVIMNSKMEFCQPGVINPTFGPVLGRT